MSDLIVPITDKNFNKEVLQADIPVLVDFTAHWCAPCVAIAPILKKIADDYNGKVKVGQLNVDENQATAQKYRVFSIPTLLLFSEGRVIGQSVGLVPMEKIEKLIQKAV
jgi:thioredoxin 1